MFYLCTQRFIKFKIAIIALNLFWNLQKPGVNPSVIKNKMYFALFPLHIFSSVVFYLKTVCNNGFRRHSKGL